MSYNGYINIINEAAKLGEVIVNIDRCSRSLQTASIFEF